MWFIRERLYLGDHNSAEDALAGASQPVQPSGELRPFAGVVSLCPMPLLPGKCLEEPASDFTEWLRLPIQDGGNGESEFEAALAVALPFVRRRMREGNVLVHCAAGMSRSVSVVAALFCEDGLDVEQAYAEVAFAKSEALCEKVSADWLIAPAAEFRSCLRRLYEAKHSAK